MLSIALLGSSRTVMAAGDSTASGGFRTVTNTVCTSTYADGVQCYDEVTEVEVPAEAFNVVEVDTGLAETSLILAVLFFGGLALFAVAQKQLRA